MAPSAIYWDKEKRELIQRLWDYLVLEMPLVRSDIIIALGSLDLRPAEHAAKLYHEGWAPRIVMSGGLSSFTRKYFSVPEAHLYRDRALALGVPSEAILVEDQSSNTGENLLFSQKLLAQSVPIHSAILVQTPNMLRRVYCTFRKMWPELNVITSAPKMSVEEATHQYKDSEFLVHEIVGDLQRIFIYPDRGFTIPQEIPSDVMVAYEKLVAMGYDKNLTF